MDEETLLRHRDLWVKGKAGTAAGLPLPSIPESVLFRSLEGNTRGQSVRLERERIRRDEARNVLRMSAARKRRESEGGRHGPTHDIGGVRHPKDDGPVYGANARSRGSRTRLTLWPGP